jgi:hypothetical protein
MLKDNDTVIHLVILVTLVSFGVLFYSLGMTGIEKQTLILEEVRQVGDRLDTLNERVSTNENMKSKEELTRPADGVVPSGTMTVSVEGFSFELPEGWYVSSDNREEAGDPEDYTGNVLMEFKNSEEVQVATMRCPVVETGYEMWEFDNSTKTIEDDNSVYEVELRLGEPLEEDGAPLNMITFTEDGEPACEFVSSDDGVSSVSDIDQSFSEVYSSVVVE